MQYVYERGDFRKYYAQIPNIADDELDPYEMRLYVHYKRVAGDGGECYEGIDTTAQKCKMGVSTVRRTRKALAAKGWIELESKGKKGKELVHVTLVDKWDDNYRQYSTSTPTTQTPPPYHTDTRTPTTQTPKEKPYKEKPIKNKENGGGNKSIATDNPSPSPLPTAAAVDDDSFIAINSALTAINKGLKKPFTGLPELTRILINNGKTVADVQALWRSCQNKQNPAGAFIHAIKNNFTPNTRPAATATASTPKPKYRRNPTTGEIEEFVGTGWGKAYGVDEEVLSA